VLERTKDTVILAKALYDWIEKEFGSSSSSRQAELWSMVWGVKVAEDEHPNTVLTSIRSTLSDLGSSVPSETTVPQFVERMSAFAMPAALPASYSLLPPTLYAGQSLSSEQVPNAINLEWRRRHQSQETNVAAGYLVKTKKQPMPAAADKNKKGGTRTTRTGKDSKTQLGPHADEYCDEHQAYGRSTDKCYKRKNAKQAAAAQTDAETTRSAQLAQVDQSCWKWRILCYG
jgi:hypothetical protein